MGYLLLGLLAVIVVLLSIAVIRTLQKAMAIQPKVKAQRELYMPDGLHPNDAGASLVADCLLSVLKQL